MYGTYQEQLNAQKLSLVVSMYNRNHKDTCWGRLTKEQQKEYYRKNEKRALNNYYKEIQNVVCETVLFNLIVIWFDNADEDYGSLQSDYFRNTVCSGVGLSTQEYTFITNGYTVDPKKFSSIRNRFYNLVYNLIIRILDNCSTFSEYMSPVNTQFESYICKNAGISKELYRRIVEG